MLWIHHLFVLIHTSAYITPPGLFALLLFRSDEAEPGEDDPGTPDAQQHHPEGKD